MIRSIFRGLLTLLLICPFLTKGQVANFTADDTAGCAPMVVHFTNTSTGATSYSWNLGNGTLSSLTDVSGAYLTAGTYTITLVASNGTSSNTRTMTIRVYGLPTVNFSASDTTVCPGSSVAFSSSSVPNAWGGLTYNWNFGDGLTSSATAPSHIYALPGNYNVTLFATNVKGCINSLNRSPYVRVYNLPSVGLSSSSTYFCSAPAFAAFTNTTVGFGPYSCFWRFGDGGTSTIANPPHNYTSPGVYDLRLKVTDGHGCIDSVYYPAYLTVANLVANFTAPAAACRDTMVSFTNTSSTHISSLWNFGDGFSSADESPSHAYAVSGSYNVRLIVFDGVCYDTVIRTIAVSHPTGSFTITPTQPCTPPRTLTFNATVPPGSTVTWHSRIFGNLGSGTTLSYAFSPIGTSAGPVGFIDSVSMAVRTSIGCRDTFGRRDTVNYLKAFITGALGGCTPVNPHLGVDVVSVVYDVFGGAPWYIHGYPAPEATVFPYPYPVSSYSWNFGDGTPGSTVPAPYHSYTLVGGSYPVSVSIVTANGCPLSVVSERPIKVGAPPPTPTFTRSPSHICGGKKITFVATATGTFDSYHWDFGDGYSDTGAVAIHEYGMPGIFNADLKTMYNDCPSLAYALRDTVDSPGAVMKYHFDCVPRTKISFIDSSWGDDTRLWQFGDGSTSTIRHPVHTYSAVGTYSVTLTTHNVASGCRDTAGYSLDISPIPMVMTVAKPSLCRGAVDTVRVKVTPNAPGLTESWVEKYRWFVDGALYDTLLTIYPYDTIFPVFHSVGTHTVTLVCTDNQGCPETRTANILVAAPNDTFNFAPVSGCAPLSVTFTDHSVLTPGTTVGQYYWLFGDGVTAIGTSPTITHVYTNSGTYYVKQVLTDNVGCKDSMISTMRPTVYRPVAAFTGSPTTLCARRNVHFTNTTTGTFTSLWLFGDGDTSSATSPDHIYTASGTYTVKLVVTNSSGCRDTLTRTNYITVRPTPVPSFYMSDSFAVCAPLNVDFTNTTTGATTYFWTFGDGTSSSSVNPSDVYITPGLYRVKLLAINAFSCTDTAIGHVNLFGYSGGFTYTPRSGCNPLPVHFTATVPPVASLVWDFSDGVTSTPSLIDTITHVYSTTGTFVPKLILTDSFGCTNFSVGTDTIKIDNIRAGFNMTPNPACPLNAITFLDTSSSYFSPITSWLWTFAPGYTSTASIPVFSYSAPGTYPVTLAVTDAWGCTATVTRNVVINSTPSAIGGPSAICVGTISTMTNAATGGVWSSSNTAVATIGSATGVITGAGLGTTTISYVLGTGCIATKVVTVNPVLAPVTGTPTMCIGTSTTLSNPVGGGVWNSGNTGIANVGSLSGVVTGVAAGTANISYSVGGCISVKIVTVYPLPSAIGGTLSVCVAQSTLLNCSTPGGVWSSSNTAIASIGSTTGFATGVAGGVATITYRLLSTGCISTAALTVNAYPAPIAGGSFVCVGGTATMTNTMPGGVWSSGNTGVATIGSNTGLVSGISIGTATITYSVAGCPVTKIASVNTLPAPVTGTNEVCMGATTTFSCATPGGVWSSASPGVASVGSSTGVVTGVFLGSTTIFYSLGAGCIVSRAVTVDPLPSSITGSGSICVGTSNTYTDVSAGGTWSTSTPGTVIIGSVTGIATGVATGSASIIYTLPTGCATALPVTVNAAPAITGLSNLCAWGDTLTIHNPNPAGSYSSSLVTVTNLGGGNGRILTYAPGTATITYTLSLGCAYVATITINPLPASIVGDPTLCVGDSTVYIDTPGVGGTWSSSNPSVGAIGALTGKVTALSAGSADIIFTLPTGCKVDTPLTVTAIPVAAAITGPSSVCPGQAITLTSSVSGGVWSISNASATISGSTVTGVSAGIDTISYTVANTCGSAVSTFVVTVNALPGAGTIVGPGVVCLGDTIQLTNATAGGVWSKWGNLVSVSAGTVIGISVGVDTIIYKVTNVCGTDSVKHAVVVNPLPQAGALSGASSVCVNDTIQLSGSVTGGVLSHMNTHTSLSSWVVTGVSAGVDTVVYTVTNSCGSAVATMPVTVDPLPDAGAIAGPSDLCIGENIVLTATVPGGTWSSSGSTIAISGSVTVNGLSAGTGTVSYTVSNNCGTDVATATVTVNPLPDDLVITRNEYVLSVAAGYAGYQWTLNGTPIAGATANTYTFKDTGAYSIIVTNAFGCSFTYQPVIIHGCNVSDLQVFPNPTVGIVYIQWCQPLKARVSCMDGKEVMELNNVTEVNLQGLANGVYTISLYDINNNRILTKRISKVTR